MEFFFYVDGNWFIFDIDLFYKLILLLIFNFFFKNDYFLNKLCDVNESYVLKLKGNISC